MAKSEHYSIRLEPEMKQRLLKAALAEGRSLANLIDRVLVQYLDEREKREGKRK